VVYGNQLLRVRGWEECEEWRWMLGGVFFFFSFFACLLRSMFTSNKAFSFGSSDWKEDYK